MLFQKYTSESHFREQFVKPLLNRLGFFAVVETHGQREFGKDFVFSEVTPLGIIRHYAAQVKHEESIQQTQHAKLSELAEQIRQAFTVPFKLADSPRERHVSAVYVFNSGSLTEGAQEYLLRILEKASFGDNVHFIDGSRLDSLNRFTSYARNQDLRMRLLGLRTQLRINTLIWQSIKEDLPSFREARGAILAAVEAFLTSPVCVEQISMEDVRSGRSRASSMQYVTDTLWA